MDEVKSEPVKAIHKEVIVNAKPDAVWNAWTTPAGMKSFFAQESKIELKPGGAYELYMAPSDQAERGSEGCKVLSYLTGEVLSFDWSAPPKFSQVRKERTCVVLTFEPIEGGKTRVTLDQHGWREGKEWDEAFGYFDKAWEHVLNELKKNYGPQ